MTDSKFMVHNSSQPLEQGYARQAYQIVYTLFYHRLDGMKLGITQRNLRRNCFHPPISRFQGRQHTHQTCGSKFPFLPLTIPSMSLVTHPP